MCGQGWLNSLVVSQSEQLSKPLCHSMKYSLVRRDPYNGLKKLPISLVSITPYIQQITNNQGLGPCSSNNPLHRGLPVTVNPQP